MPKWLNEILDWSEVWALLIPIIVLIWRKGTSIILRPIVIYIILAFVMNFAQDYIWKAGVKFSFSLEKGDNTFIYNSHSIIRLLLFSALFISIKQSILSITKKIIPVLFILFVVINFYWYEKFINFSSRTLGMEAGIELYFCLLYFLNLMQQDIPFLNKKTPEFWIIVGLSIYVVINFPIFLFYLSLSAKFQEFAIDIWSIHNILYIIFCMFIAKGFFEGSKINRSKHSLQ